MPVNPIPTTEDRVQRGRSARRVAPRSALGGWEPAADREDPVVVLLAQNDIRNPDLVALRHGRMSASPWNFYRGAAAVMAMDLAALPHSGLAVQLCGDAHVLNFGLWATPERNLSFDLRDFDETLPGPFEWDVARLAASIVVLARHNGLGDQAGLEAVDRAVDAYCARMAAFAQEGQMEVWYELVDVDWLLTHFDTEPRANLAALIAKQSTTRTNQGALAKLTAMVDGQRRIAENPPKLAHFDAPDRLRIVEEVFERYAATLRADRRHCLRQFGFVDVARQVVGVGSVGMRVHLLLLEDRTGEPLFLQVKQAGPSVYERHLGPSTYENHGARVINGQRLLQSATDMFVGWTSYEGSDFYVRQFRDMKIIPNTEQLAPVLADFATACGAVLAKGHARTGDAAAISAYLGKGHTFTDAMEGFAVRYADRTEADHATLVEAIRAGSVPAESG
jgi:uncharacterized protein (DUF2252 family)